MRVLLVEDEEKMASFVERGLKEEGYEVDVAADGNRGWELASQNDYDLMVFDWMIPHLSGIELCQKIRETGNSTPILMLTAKDSIEFKVTGLDKGADDYMTKPFNFEELVARIRALMRRPANVKEETVLSCGNLSLDLVRRKCYLNEEKVVLSQKEFGLLEHLMRHKGEVVSRTQIAQQVWDLNFDPMSNTIDVYINFLRKKIDVGRRKSCIETVRGMGYRLVDE